MHTVSLFCETNQKNLLDLCFLGIKRFSNDVKMMLGVPPNIYFKVTWMFLTPVYMMVRPLIIKNSYLKKI